jgi:hypothetical protein
MEIDIPCNIKHTPVEYVPIGREPGLLRKYGEEEEENRRDPTHSLTKKQAGKQEIRSDKPAPQQSGYSDSMPAAC